MTGAQPQQPRLLASLATCSHETERAMLAPAVHLRADVRAQALAVKWAPEPPPSATSKTLPATAHQALGAQRLPNKALLSLQDIVSGPKSHTNSHKPKSCEVRKQAAGRWHTAQHSLQSPQDPSSSLRGLCPPKRQCVLPRVTASFPGPQGGSED